MLGVCLFLLSLQANIVYASSYKERFCQLWRRNCTVESIQSCSRDCVELSKEINFEQQKGADFKLWRMDNNTIVVLEAQLSNGNRVVRIVSSSPDNVDYQVQSFQRFNKGLQGKVIQQCMVTLFRASYDQDIELPDCGRVEKFAEQTRVVPKVCEYSMVSGALHRNSAHFVYHVRKGSALCVLQTPYLESRYVDLSRLHDNN